MVSGMQILPKTVHVPTPNMYLTLSEYQYGYAGYIK